MSDDKRPSSKCKTSYVADIKLLNNELTLAHTPSLGYCGLCEKDCFVMVRENKTKKNFYKKMVRWRF